ncbi:hypothetical protein H1235_10195 [Pseudoxanthomonas sp. NC8]|nr:hypothetical protein H1235_10195 [Pseudoxanthomonas sp. NC8]
MTDQEKSPDAFMHAMEERRLNPSKRTRSLPDDFASRPFGLILLAIGLLCLWLSTYVPISGAQEQVASISYKAKWVFIQPFCFLLGLAYTLFGESASRVLGPTTRPSVWGWILAIAAGVLGFFYEGFISNYLNGLGYPV